MLTVPGYQAFYSPPIPRGTCTATGGKSFLPGSCLFVPESLSPQHPQLCDDIEQSCVLLNVSCCFLQCQHFKVAVASVYCSPSVDIEQCIGELFTLLSQLSTCTQYIILAGDLNIDLLQPTNHQRKYIDCLTDFQLVQLISDRTIQSLYFVFNFN